MPQPPERRRGIGSNRRSVQKPRGGIVEVNLAELAQALAALGCPQEQCGEMASQLDKRARQLSELKGTSYEAAMAHLLTLMQQGWAAQERGL